MAAQRDDLVDELRGYALLGVFVVNFASYTYGLNGSAIGLVEPAHSKAAMVAHAIAGAFFQAKSYPLLAFLVGYSLALTLRTAQRRGQPRSIALAQRRDRTLRQLALGVVHGTFLYYGDILTAYSLMTFVLLSWSRARLSGLRTRFLILVAGVIAINGSFMALAFFGDEPAQGLVYDVGRLTHAHGWAQLMQINASMFLDAAAGLIVIVPWLGVPATLGLIAGRLHWLERPDRWAAQWKQIASIALPLGLLANIAYGVGTTWASVNRDANWIGTGEAIVSYIGLLLSAGLVSAAAVRYHRGSLRGAADALAPLGRLSLSVYIGHSIAMQLLFGGSFLGLAPSLGSAGLLLAAFGYWVAMILLARMWVRAGRRGPLETWMAHA